MPWHVCAYYITSSEGLFVGPMIIYFFILIHGWAKMLLVIIHIVPRNAKGRKWAIFVGIVHVELNLNTYTINLKRWCFASGCFDKRKIFWRHRFMYWLFKYNRFRPISWSFLLRNILLKIFLKKSSCLPNLSWMKTMTKLVFPDWIYVHCTYSIWNIRMKCKYVRFWVLTQPLLLQVEDELHLIFKVLGTPTEDNWPGINR